MLKASSGQEMRAKVILIKVIKTKRCSARVLGEATDSFPKILKAVGVLSGSMAKGGRLVCKFSMQLQGYPVKSYISSKGIS